MTHLTVCGWAGSVHREENEDVVDAALRVMSGLHGVIAMFCWLSASWLTTLVMTGGHD